jgi:HAE1 family hydrophobic/amphiphilic exporter-1
VAVTVRKQSGTNTVEVVDRVPRPPRADQANAAAGRADTTSATISRGSFAARSKTSRCTCSSAAARERGRLHLHPQSARHVHRALAVPTSIIGTFTFMKLLGFTLNNMTMLALSLATGIVIDDAIVVLENIFRFVERKASRRAKRRPTATREIGLAVMATTLSLVVIFVPVAFMTGQIGATSTASASPRRRRS